MTDDDDDPFGLRDRTIIRPNPGGRRPASPPEPAPNQPRSPGASPPQSTAAARVSYPSSPPAGSGEGVRGQRLDPPSHSPRGESSGGSAVRPTSPQVSVDLVAISTDPIMSAAAFPLLLLGRLRASVSRALSVELLDQLARAIEQFEIKVRAAGVPTEQTAVAKYVLSATADDVVQNLPKLDDAARERFSMLARFFNERAGEARFFQELERAKKNPPVNLGLLELMHACLSLGFEGRYRAAGGAGGLQKERRDLYETIRRDRPKPIEDLSPHWRGQTIALARAKFEAPVWSVAAFSLAILFGVYLFLRGELSARASALAVALERLHPDTEIAIARSKPVKPPVEPPKSTSSQFRRIREALADEITAKKVDASQTSTRIILTIGNSILFSSGGAKVNDGFVPLAAKIAKSLDKEPGVIQIDGYTDSDPIKTLAFPSNFELSEARAKSVAAILKADLAQPERLRVAGKGEANAVAPNDTESDKSKNRRVEISIPRAD